jgi:hypothetical protein
MTNQPAMIRGSLNHDGTLDLRAKKASRAKKSVGTGDPEPRWETLIDFRETHPLYDTMLDGNLSASIPDLGRRGHRTFWPMIATAAGLLLLGLLIARAVVLRFKTANGTIELVNVPRDAVVFVDGEAVTVSGLGGGKPVVITVSAGKHKIMVKKDGLEILGDEVTVKAEDQE